MHRKVIRCRPKKISLLKHCVLKIGKIISSLYRFALKLTLMLYHDHSIAKVLSPRQHRIRPITLPPSFWSYNGVHRSGHAENTNRHDNPEWSPTHLKARNLLLTDLYFAPHHIMNRIIIPFTRGCVNNTISKKW